MKALGHMTYFSVIITAMVDPSATTKHERVPILVS